MEPIKNIYRQYAPTYLKVKIKRYVKGHKIYHNYNDRYRCIFIHIPKTAGTSLQKTLFDFTHTGHLRWDEYKAESRIKFKEYFKFAFVRNPWDRLVSAYEYLRAGGRNTYDKAWADKVLINYPSFENFVLEWISTENILKSNHFIPQTDFIFDNRDNLKIDFLGRYENLKEDYLSISEKLDSTKELVNINNSLRSNYQSYYNPKTINIVSRVYARDVALLGYSYDE